MSPDEALAQILAVTERRPAVDMPLIQAINRIAGNNIKALISHPARHISAMDGYAFADMKPVETSFTVAGEFAAGDYLPEGMALKAGECWRVFTGSPVGPAARVLPQEQIELLPSGDIKPVQGAFNNEDIFIRAQGADFLEGETLITEGTRLSTRHIALAASANHPSLPVIRPVRISLLATGSELSKPGTKKADMVASSSFALESFFSLKGADIQNSTLIPDAPEKILGWLKEQLPQSDLLITTGGVSVGKHDYVIEALRRAGVDILFHNIAMRPGKPTGFGCFGGCRVFALPGNPVSALVTAMVLMLPCFYKMGGLAPPLEVKEAILKKDLPANGKRVHYMRALYQGGRITALDSQDSALSLSLAKAEGLIIRPANAPILKAGNIVPFLPFPEGF